MVWLMLTITLIPTVCTMLYPIINLPSSNQQKMNLSKFMKERSVRPKVSPRQMLILKLGMDTITVLVDMVDIVDTTDLLIDIVDTTDIPDTDTEGTVTDGANRYFNLDQTNSKFRS